METTNTTKGTYWRSCSAKHNRAGTKGSFSKCYPRSRSDLLPIFPVEQREPAVRSTGLFGGDWVRSGDIGNNLGLVR